MLLELPETFLITYVKFISKSESFSKEKIKQEASCIQLVDITLSWLLGTSLHWGCHHCATLVGSSCANFRCLHWHYSDVIMSAMASQITGVSLVYSIVCSDAEQRKIKAPRHIHRWPMNSPHKGPVTRKCFHLMQSQSWNISVTSAIVRTDGNVQHYTSNTTIIQKWIIEKNVDIQCTSIQM